MLEEKSSLLPYYLPHALGALGVATALAGWFYLPNLGSILGS